MLTTEVGKICHKLTSIFSTGNGKDTFGPKAFEYQAADDDAGSDSDSDIVPGTKKFYGLKLETTHYDSDCSSESGEVSDKESVFQEDTNGNNKIIYNTFPAKTYAS